MTPFEKYVLILCLIVFVLLTTVFSSMLIILTKQSIRLIHLGEEDERIYKEHLKSLKRKHKQTGWFSKTFTVLFACVVIVIASLTLYVQLNEKKPTKSIPSIRVVYSNSMSDKYLGNTYLFENDLNNQFDRFDLVVTYELPNEMDLQLYDIVVYEVDGYLLIHRIIKIEEPNKEHPNERHFVLQGDNVERPDKQPVLYSQMKAIYRGNKIPYIGNFVMFLQSPAGWICIILILVTIFGLPIMEKKLDKITETRLAYILEKKLEEQPAPKAIPVKKKILTAKRIPQGRKRQQGQALPILFPLPLVIAPLREQATFEDEEEKNDKKCIYHGAS